MTVWPNTAGASDRKDAQDTQPLLLRPGPQQLAAYCFALGKGWSPDNLRPESAEEKLDWIARDPRGFLDRLEDLEGKGPPVWLPDGSDVALAQLEALDPE